MKRHNPQAAVLIAVVIILVTGLMVYALAAKANELSHKIVAKSVRNQTDELITSLSEEDYVIYFLGTVPPELEPLGVHLINIGFNRISEDNMPVYWDPYTYTLTDELGNVIEQHAPRDYSQHMLIVVNSDYPLDEGSLEILRNCSVDNNVPIMFIGETTANSFRTSLLLSERSYGENGIMYYQNRTPYDGPVLGEDGEAYTTRELANSVLTYMAELVGVSNYEGGDTSGN